MKVLAINGSARRGGNTAILLKTVMAELEANEIETELIELGPKPIGGCIACYKCAERLNKRCAVEGDALNDILAKMLDADGVLLGSPVYFSDASANMRAVIERCGVVSRSNGNLLKRKVGAAVISVRRAGATFAMSSINFFFTIGEMVVPGSSYWNMGIGKTPGEVANDEEGLKTMRDLGVNMAWVMDKLKK